MLKALTKNIFSKTQKFLCAHLLMMLLPISLCYGQSQQTLKVGTSGDYAPYSLKIADNSYEGFDIAVAELYAKDKDLEITWVPFQWVNLDNALKQEDFDIAMSGITITPSRSIAGEFTIPVATMEGVVLVKASKNFNNLEALNHENIKLGVNRGGYLEKAARQQFPNAKIITFSENYDVAKAFQTDKIDAAITETQEARYWGAGEPNVDLLSPFTHDNNAYLAPAGKSDLVADLNQWLLDREADGTLAKLRSKYLDESISPSIKTATPLYALLASVNERLALMPLVAKIKYAQNIPVEAPEQEAQVIAQAVASVNKTTKARAISAPAESAIKDFMRAQIEAAKYIQNAELLELKRLGEDKSKQNQNLSPPYSLDEDIRLAIIWIDDKIANLVLTLPSNLKYKDVLSETRNNLQTLGLDETHIQNISMDIANISNQSLPKLDEEYGIIVTT